MCLPVYVLILLPRVRSENKSLWLLSENKPLWLLYVAWLLLVFCTFGPSQSGQLQLFQSLVLTGVFFSLAGASTIPSPPPPPAAPPPPPNLEVPMQSDSRPVNSTSRGALLSSIQNFQKGTLKKTETCDCSAPKISWNCLHPPSLDILCVF